MEPEQVVEDGLLKVRHRTQNVTLPIRDFFSANRCYYHLQSIGGFTWPGIEFGHYPTFKYSFFQVQLLKLTPFLKSC